MVMVWLIVVAKTACAIVPLTARNAPTISGGRDNNPSRPKNEERIRISNYIPHTPEYVLLGQQSEWRNIFIAPKIRADVLGSGAELSGLGVNKQRLEQQSYTISLVPTLDTDDGQPDYLQW